MKREHREMLDRELIASVETKFLLVEKKKK